MPPLILCNSVYLPPSKPALKLSTFLHPAYCTTLNDGFALGSLFNGVNTFPNGPAS